MEIEKKNSKEEENFDNFSKEELISKIKSLTAHNLQLKNIIAKSLNDKNNSLESKSFNFTRYNFRHIALKILYLGWDCKGYVIQEETNNTIEHHLFKALKKTCLIKDRTVSNYHRCGRTDKGVSSFGQVISIDLRSNLSDKCMEELNYCKILNRVLPDFIRCVGWSPVDDDFSARFDCKTRIYKYFFPRGSLDTKKMEMASEKLLGHHDFRNFCKMDVGNGVTEFMRTIFKVQIQPVNKSNSNDCYAMYVITIQANAFLWHQIRYIMGVLFLVGQNKEDPGVIDELLDVTKNPRKPEYSMASEIPLNLHTCEYNNIAWNYDKESMSALIETISKIWTFNSIKEVMLKDMLDSLKMEYSSFFKDDYIERKCLSENLITGLKTKKHIPLLKRQTCNSLEDKINHFVKRKRIDVNKTEK